jgi:hypothetical protein
MIEIMREEGKWGREECFGRQTGRTNKRKKRQSVNWERGKNY